MFDKRAQLLCMFLMLLFFFVFIGGFMLLDRLEPPEERCFDKCRQIYGYQNETLCFEKCYVDEIEEEVKE